MSKLPSLLTALGLAAAIHGCAPPAGAPTSPEALGPPVRPERGIVRVQLESTDPGRELELRGYGASRLEPVGDGTFRAYEPTRVLCRAPCDAVVDARGGEPLLVGGPDTPASAPFRLDSMQGGVRIRAEPGSAPLLVTGTVATALGGLGALGGGGALVLGLVSRSGELTDTPDRLVVGGGIAMGVSAVVLGAGLLMSYLGATYVELTPQGVAF